MTDLPSDLTPLNRHSLMSLEQWLRESGAKPNNKNPSEWIWEFSQWTTHITMERDELRVTWLKEGLRSQCYFSYRLMRKDVEEAIRQGP
tara:strand:+ start:299 stop:565 length:267 start_codon:yes stop_codon:yes gene_type:complete